MDSVYNKIQSLFYFLDQDEIQAVKAVSAEEKRKERILAEIDVDDDSEEEMTTTVGEKDLNVYKKNELKSVV